MTTTPKRAGRGESLIQGLIMLAVASMAGAASFTHVHDWTMHNSPAGTGNWFGWANAMVSELIPLAAGLEMRRRIRHFGTAGFYPVALIVGAVALSLTGQFAEAKHSPSGWLIAAVPALGFLALVKLVLSSPPTPTVVEPTPAVEPPAPSTAIVPAGILDPPVLPAHLIGSARFAATNHQHTTGQAITAGELATLLSIPADKATAVLRQLHTDTPARINGHTVGVGQ
jgi:hypothetical protein